MQITGEDLLIGVSIEDLAALATENPSLRGYLQGYIAEMFLKRKLEQIEGISEVEKIPDHDKARGDFRMKYLGTPLTVEVKSMSTKTVKEDILNGGYSATVQVKNSDSVAAGDGTFTKALRRGEFDILAVSAFAIGQGWDFYFIANKYLPASPSHPDRLKTSFVINTSNTPCLHTDFLEVVRDVIS